MTAPRPRVQVITTAQGAMAHITGPAPAMDIDLTEADALRLLEQVAGAVLHLRAIAQRAQREEEAPPHFIGMQGE